MVMMASLWLLVAGVTLKCLLFAWFSRRSLRWPRGLATMLVANLLSTIVGFMASIPFTAPILLIGCVPVLFALALEPARRYAPWLSAQIRRRVAPSAVAALVTVVFIVSIVLWGLAQGRLDRADYPLYWGFKLGYIFTALVLSNGLTIYFEDWMVSRLNRTPAGAIPFFPAVARANLYTLLLLMAIAAAKVIPTRLQHPHFLLLSFLDWMRTLT